MAYPQRPAGNRVASADKPRLIPIGAHPPIMPSCGRQHDADRLPFEVHEAAAIFRETGDRHGEDIALKNLESDRAAQRT